MWSAFKLLFRASPMYSLLCLALVIAEAALGVLVLTQAGTLAAAHSDKTALLRAIIVLAVVLLIRQLVRGLADLSSDLLNRAVNEKKYELLAGLSLRLGFQHLERLRRLDDEGRNWIQTDGARYTYSVVGYACGLVASLLVVARWSAVMAGILLGLLILSLFFQMRMLKAGYDKAQNEITTLRQQRQTLWKSIIRLDNRVESIVFNQADWLLSKLNDHTSKLSRAERTNAFTRRDLLLSMLFLSSSLAVSLGLLLFDATRGQVRIEVFSAVTLALISLHSLGNTANEFLRFLDFASWSRNLFQLSMQPKHAEVQVWTPDLAPGTVQCDHLTFTYPGVQNPIIKDLSLDIKPGEFIGLVGRNGCGKSTLVRIIAGILVAEGRVQVGGQRRPAVVFQYPWHFPDSLSRNISLDQRHIDEAVELVGLDSLIDTLPAGPDTVLGGDIPGSRNLSGGQWQKLALARVVAQRLAGASVIILDEPAANLDIVQETALYQGFGRLKGTATAIVVSHRLASVRHCDRIVVLDNGTITEQGTHDELMARHGLYAQLFHVQRENYGAVEVDRS